MKLKNILIPCVVAGGLMTFSSCNDFLDREPLSSITPETYFATADHFAAYSINLYGNFSVHSGFGMGIGAGDTDTDNAVSGSHAGKYEEGYWKVPQSGGGWDFSAIRSCNYFFENALPKYEAGKVTGNVNEIKHYIGEMYFMRAWIYFGKLRSFGDYPIITEVLPDTKEVLIEKAVRQPRNKVARFILEDLDKAIEYLQDWGFKANNRINKQVAQLVKSRVALYEATFEKYHQGTGRVPGDANWTGKDVHPGYSLNVASEVDFFLTEAMEAAEAVADRVQLTENTGEADPAAVTITSGWNPYVEMFGSVNLSGNPEVLMWRAYDRTAASASSHGTPAYIYSGGGNGLLKTYVESFLMEDGLPWYAASADAPYMGDETLDNVKANRDDRLQLFMFGESNMLPMISTMTEEVTKYFLPHVVAVNGEVKDVTGYRLRKYISFDKAQNVSGKNFSTTGCIVFRGVEAYLNYLEAYYEKNGKVDGKAANYWKAVRERAGVNPDFNKTTAATDMAKETDWAKQSGGQDIDPMLLNIRRERRCEFIGEAMRWNDLVRWRSLDHLLTEKFIPEGCNFWTSLYKTAIFNENEQEVTFAHTGEPGSNISSPELSKYIQPFRIIKANNPVWDGYTFAKAHYLSPVPIREIELLSPDESISTSVIYQNPYWPNTIDGSATE